jgi:peroxiredoxin
MKVARVRAQGHNPAASKRGIAMLSMLGQQAPDFALTDLQGRLLQLSALRGTPVLLNFFKSTCAWCQTEMPWLADIYRCMASVHVQVIGVVVGKDDAASVERFAHDKTLNFPLAVDNERQVRAAYGLQRVPSLVLIDAEGKVARVYEGSSEQLAGIVEQTVLAAARGDSPPDYYLVGNG